MTSIKRFLCIIKNIQFIVTISQKVGSLSGTKTYNGTHEFSAGTISYFQVRLLFFAV